MFKEKISSQEAHDDYREDIIREYLGDRENLEKEVRDRIIEAKKGGGFKIGSSSFIKSIIGPRAGKINPDDYGICHEEIMKVVNEISSTRRRKAKEGKIVKKDLAALAAEAELEEEKRTGVSPEEFSQM